MEDKIKQMQRDIALIDELLIFDTEKRIVESKHNNIQEGDTSQFGRKI